MEKFNKPIKSELVSRSFVNYRASESEDGNSIIEGTPIVFDTPAIICGMWEETIARDAISKDVLKDVAFFFNHDLNTKPIARTRTKKLNFEIKDDGVHMVANVNRQRSDVNDLYLAIQDGDIDGMSFMFRVDEDEWTDLDTDMPKRKITKISYVQEVSAVNYPAYDETSVNTRATLELDRAKELLEEVRANSLDSEGDKDKTNSLELEKLKASYLYKINF